MIPQSATSISDFKTCPTLFFLRHVLRLRPAEEADSLRQGTNWHKCLEILTDPEGGRDAMIAHLNEAYTTCPASVELSDWETERIVILYSAIGWEWYWQNDQIETLAREVQFNRQVNNMYARRGKIDRIIRRETRRLLGEYKSTGKLIDSGSVYWDHLKLDSQISMYLIEARHAQISGQLGRDLAPGDPLISGVLYDVWHKPAIRPKNLTQAESKKFLDDGMYYGEKFEIMTFPIPCTSGDGQAIEVNGISAQVIPGAEPKPTKKNPKPERPVAVRETPEMFGARLLADIKEYPDKHFARREIARTDQELARFDEEFGNIARLTHFMEQRNLWYKNEHQCNATYRCSFYPVCVYGQDVSNGNVPAGFVCLNRKEK